MKKIEEWVKERLEDKSQEEKTSLIIK